MAAAGIAAVGIDTLPPLADQGESVMQITIELPDEIANQLQADNIAVRVLELIAADRYRQGQIGATEVRQMLNLASRWETYEFLKQEKAYLTYTEDNREQDVQNIRSILRAE